MSTDDTLSLCGACLITRYDIIVVKVCGDITVNQYTSFGVVL